MEEQKQQAAPEKKDSVLRDISKQAVNDIIVPKAMETTSSTLTEIIYMIADALSQATLQFVAKVIFKKDQMPTTTRSGSGRDKYSNISRNKSQPQTTNVIDNRRSDDLQYVVVDSYQKAEAIKKDLIDAITKYGRVRVADLYEKSEKVRPVISDFNYGWTNVNDVHFVRDRNGYWFNMPKPVQLNK